MNKLKLYSDAYDILEKNEVLLEENEELKEIKLEIFANTNRRTEAARLMERMELSFSRDKNWWSLNPELKLENGDTIGAIALLQQYADTMQMSEIYQKLLPLLEETQQWEQSYNYSKKWILIDSIKVDPFYYKALAHKNLNQKDSAQIFYQFALEKDSSHFKSLYNLGILYLQKKKYNMAYDFLKRAYFQKPTHPNLAFKLGICAMELKDSESAIEYFQNIDSSDINYTFAQTKIQKIKLREQ